MSDGQLKVQTENNAKAGTTPNPAAEVVAKAMAPGAPWAALRSLRAETEIHAISRALEESKWNRKHAAKLLSISYRGLLYKIRQYNITPAPRGNGNSQPQV